MLMEIAGIMAQRSTCSRGSVGAVLSLAGRILTTGYNGTPAGMPHCDHTCRCTASKTTSRFIPPAMLQWGHEQTCAAVGGCKLAVHAEANAVAYAARHGVSVEGCEAYVTMSPCVPCAQLLINAGVVRVVYDRAYRDLSSVLLLDAAGVDVVKYGS
jgi:dCMP deaminase